jgi:hypothetical protein
VKLVGYLLTIAMLAGCLDQKMGVRTSQDVTTPDSLQSPISAAMPGSEPPNEIAPQDRAEPPPAPNIYKGGAG